MAPKGMKRPSAAAAGGAGKRPKVDKEAVKKCTTIGKALAGAEGPLPPVVFAMLSKMLPESLLTFAEERHDFQAKAVGMAGDALAAIEADLKAAIVPLEAKVANADQEQVAKTEAQSTAQADLDAKKADVPVKKEAVDAGKAALAAATAAVTGALKAQKEGDAEAEKNLKRKDELQGFIEGAFTALKGGAVPAKEVKAALKMLSYLANEFSFDAELIKSAHVTLSTPAGSRGTFDCMIVSELDKLLGSQLEKVQAEITAAEPAKEARASAVMEAEADKTAAAEKIKELEAEHVAAVEAEMGAAAALKAATAAVKGHAADAAGVAKACKVAQEKLAQFQAGALAAFSELQAYAPPPPPPVVEKEPEPAEAAPAEAEPEPSA